MEYKDHKDYEEEEGRKGPLIYLIALLMVLMMIVTIIPYYSIKLDPSPKPEDIPKLSEVLPKNITLPSEKEMVVFANQYNSYLEPNNPQVKQVAATVAARSCGSNEICQAKAIFYFVRDNIDYVGDPPDEYIETPLETLSTGGADCDGMAVLLASLERAIGVQTRFVFIPKHVYVQIYIEDALEKYKDSAGWINLDPTCDGCEFGEIPYQNVKKDKKFV